MVIPDRHKTFDHSRPLTDPNHFLDDYRNRVNQCDGTHINDFVYGVDWAMFSPSTVPTEERSARDQLASGYRNAIESSLQINIHFHTFELSNALSLIEIGNRESVWNGSIQVLEVAESFPETCPNGFLIVARVNKVFRDRFRSFFSKHVLREDAHRP